LVLAIPLLAIGGAYLYAKSIFDGVDRVPVADVLDPVEGDFVNYLLVGSDAREGTEGNRSDTIILLHVTPEGSKIMSVPRDLWVPIAETDETRKINAAYNGGPKRLILTVKNALDVPVNRYVEVSFNSFGPIVDAMGGIEITFNNAAYDRKSGFQVPSAGTHRLDGFNALAYVRSRHYVEVIDGETKTDPTGDLGREQRQQTFLMRTFQKMGEIRNPSKLAEVGKALAAGLKVDDAMSMGDAFSVARQLGGTTPTSVVLPTVSDREGSALVERFGEPAEVNAALDQFR
jgi:LCP family protein required for cell wall assembly